MSTRGALSLVTLAAMATVGGCFLDAEGVTEGPPPCNNADECPDPGPCAERVCTDGFCVPEPVADGLLGAQVAGDCETRSCVGGELQAEADPTDSDDGRSCTDDACTAGGPVHDPLPAGSECMIGTVAGECSDDGDCLIECSDSAPCPEADPCLAPACVDQFCEYSPVSGEPVSPVQDPTDGDCKRPFCAAGVLGSTTDGNDLPPDDGLECTTGVCNGDQPMQMNLSAGSPCGIDLACDGNGACDGCTANNQCGAPFDCTTPTCGPTFECTNVYSAVGTVCSDGFCKAGGACVECITAANCSPSMECMYSTCDADVCNPHMVPAGSPCLLTIANRCNAAGACVECLTVNDCPAPTDCVSYTCSAGGTCTPVLDPVGTACATGYCDATGACVECTLPSHCTTVPEICCMGTCKTPPC
ncbi:MAG: hypothetical protein JNK04_24175 [Myxococcales bacterium]|nr:hypothetical protein [Myxococcales bacterium]